MIGVSSFFFNLPNTEVRADRNGKGKIGKSSAAAKFASATASNDFSIQDEKPYAEVC